MHFLIPAVGVLIVIFVLWLVLGGIFIARISVFPPKLPLFPTPEKYKLISEDVEFPSRDGTVLRGWWIAMAKPRGVIVLCHGMTGNRANMLSWALPLLKSGYSVLLFDFRAAGKSEGERCTVGYREVQDLQGALDYLQTRKDCDGLKIGAMGFSMGGSVVVRTAARDNRLAACCSYAGFASLPDALKQRCKHHFGPFAFIVEKIVLLAGKEFKWFEVNPQEIVPDLAAPHIQCPLLVMQGRRDPIVPHTHSRRLVEAAPAGMAILRQFPKSSHGPPHYKEKQEAEMELVQFMLIHINNHDTEAIHIARSV